MGNGMNKIIEGLYVGNFRDAKDEEELKKNRITHILSIHDNAKQLLKDKTYLCIIASDSPDQDLTQHFPQCVDFIHSARLNNGRVLVHCLAGVSRSVTIAAAYIMTVTEFGWRDSLHAIRGARNCANPNFGFQRQLMRYESEKLAEERKRLKEEFASVVNDDDAEVRQLLVAYNKFVLHGPSCDDYPLPLDAYSNRKKSNRCDNDDEEEVNGNTVAVSDDVDKQNMKGDIATTSDDDDDDDKQVNGDGATAGDVDVEDRCSTRQTNVNSGDDVECVRETNR